jgi:large subunit ribosomal protein L7/L12
MEGEVMTNSDLLDRFKTMTLIELSAFIREFEDTFGVTAAAQVTAVPVPPAPEVAEAEEQDEFTVMLDSAGQARIQVIKAVRQLGGLGLSEAKQLVDKAPVAVLSGVGKDTADKARAALETAGAAVTVR